MYINKNKIKEVLKDKKVIIAIILSSLFLTYFFAVRPSQIRKQCSVTTKYDSYQYTNPKYNEVAEREKQRKLVEYIQCRNDNLAEGDQKYINKEGLGYHELTQNDYSSLSLEELNQRILGGLSPRLFYVYDGYIIDIPTYENLKENKYKYSQCNFSDNFIEKELSKSSQYTTTASDTEYKICLRKHGLDDGDKKLSQQEIRESINICKKWGGEVLYDKNNQYRDCMINGKIGEY